MFGSSSSKSQLILHIIQSHFGDTVKDVARFIMNCKDCSFMTLCRHFSSLTMDKKLSVSQVRDSLLVLFNHNCIYAERPSSQEDDDDTQTPQNKMTNVGLLYVLNDEMILNRLRFPQLVRITQDLFGNAGSLVIQEMILKNRLTYQGILSEVKSKLHSAGISASNDTTVSATDIHVTFENMVRRRFLIPLTQPEIPRRPKFKETKAGETFNSISGSKHKSDGVESKQVPVKRKRVMISSMDANEQSTDVLPPEMRLIMKGEYPNNGRDLHDNSSTFKDSKQSVESSASLQVVNTAVRGLSSSRGRGRGKNIHNGRGSNGIIVNLATGLIASSTSEPPNEVFVNNNVVWTIGWEQLIREERHEKCIEIARLRMENVAGLIVKIILDSSINTELKATEAFSSPLSFIDILEQLKLLNSKQLQNSSALKQISSDPTTLKNLLELLRNDGLGIVDKVAGSDSDSKGASYYVNMESIIGYAKRKTIHSIATSRYDVASSRIVELLHQKKYIEQQQIADMAILPARDVREKLYKLYKDKWVDFLELSKRTDFNPSSTNYFWYLDHSRLQQSILNNMYKSILNLRTRIDYDLAAVQSQGIQSSLTTELNEPMSDGQINNGKVKCKIGRLEVSAQNIMKTVSLLVQL